MRVPGRPYGPIHDWRQLAHQSAPPITDAIVAAFEPFAPAPESWLPRPAESHRERLKIDGAPTSVVTPARSA
ncbi:hypothetical protein RP20_CCG028125 [Aedes albopictus]|nr:hypothetical protein RP20_CCG028125 [Aedes albopictus]